MLWTEAARIPILPETAFFLEFAGFFWYDNDTHLYHIYVYLLMRLGESGSGGGEPGNAPAQIHSIGDI